ncbi:hypothetical protein GGF43_001221, partial [Coemansia sp. RSA 2618]
MFARSIVIATLGALASAHMAMVKPCSRYTPNHGCPDPPAGQSVDYSLSSPLAPDAPFCKYAVPYDKPVETWTAGQTVDIEFNKEAGAGHGGGHCEFSISYDGKTFAVIHQVLRHCFYNGPSTSNSPDVRSFSFALPKDLPSSDHAVFAWTWVNKEGNREFYCGTSDVAITGSDSKSYTGKEMTIANHDGYPTIPEFGDNYDTGLDVYNSAKNVTVSPGGSSGSSDNSSGGSSAAGSSDAQAEGSSDKAADTASVTSAAAAKGETDAVESDASAVSDTSAAAAEDSDNAADNTPAAEDTAASADDTAAAESGDGAAEDTSASGSDGG